MERIAGETFATTIINVEEQIRGWLAFIKRFKDLGDQIPGYASLARMLEFYSEWDVFLLDDHAVDQFDLLKKGRIQIGTQDLKIAAIVLANDGLLLSANLKDFKKVPGLRVENWLE
jgi:tRNA(fMet)-specific endonuclease VapC